MVIPKPHQGSGAFCDLHQVRSKGGESALYFFFQKKKFVYSKERKMFEKLDYPDHHAYSFAHYNGVKGLQDDTAVRQARNKYGLNRCVIIC
jgi:cation-transporting ATPase 13A1